MKGGELVISLKHALFALFVFSVGGECQSQSRMKMFKFEQFVFVNYNMRPRARNLQIKEHLNDDRSISNLPINLDYTSLRMLELSYS